MERMQVGESSQCMHPMLKRWASLFVPDAQVEILVERTIWKATESLLPADMSPDKALFCIMHGLILDDLKRQAKERAKY